MRLLKVAPLKPRHRASDRHRHQPSTRYLHSPGHPPNLCNRKHGRGNLLQFFATAQRFWEAEYGSHHAAQLVHPRDFQCLPNLREVGSRVCGPFAPKPRADMCKLPQRICRLHRPTESSFQRCPGESAGRLGVRDVTRQCVRLSVSKLVALASLQPKACYQSARQRQAALPMQPNPSPHNHPLESVCTGLLQVAFDRLDRNSCRIHTPLSAPAPHFPGAGSECHG